MGNKVKINLRKKLSKLIRHRSVVEIIRKDEIFDEQKNKWILDKSTLVHESDVRLLDYEFVKMIRQTSGTLISLSYIRSNDNKDRIGFHIKDGAELKHTQVDKWTDKYSFECDTMYIGPNKFTNIVGVGMHKHRATLTIRQKRCDDVLLTPKYNPTWTATMRSLFRKSEEQLSGFNVTYGTAIEKLIHRDLTYDEMNFIYHAVNALAHQLMCQDDGK